MHLNGHPNVHSHIFDQNDVACTAIKHTTRLILLTNKNLINIINLVYCKDDDRLEDSTMASIRSTRRTGGLHTLLLLLGWICFEGDSQRISPCPGTPGSDGYLTIQDIALDIQDEVGRIEKGGFPLPSYNYAICPKAKLQFNESDLPIAAAFDGTSFTCGDDNSGSGCEIHGGDTQFVISEENLVSKSGKAAIMAISFKGIVFSGFSKSAITIAGAEEVVSVSVLDCKFVVRCDGTSVDPPRQFN